MGHNQPLSHREISNSHRPEKPKSTLVHDGKPFVKAGGGNPELVHKNCPLRCLRTHSQGSPGTAQPGTSPRCTGATPTRRDEGIDPQLGFAAGFTQGLQEALLGLSRPGLSERSLAQPTRPGRPVLTCWPPGPRALSACRATSPRSPRSRCSVSLWQGGSTKSSSRRAASCAGRSRAAQRAHR